MLRTTILLLLVWVAGQSRQCASGADLFFRQGVGGEIGIHMIKSDESLVELARHYDLGFNEIEAANPGVDPFVPAIGSMVTIPGRWLLPDVSKQTGILLNVAEMRLYYFPPNSKDRIVTFPVGIGDDGWETPLGTYSVTEKIKNPSWHVPASIRAQQPELPAIVPPGPDNPLGTHALRLSVGTVLIHGTARPFGIGRRVSHGCIHLYPEDIVRLFRMVKHGTRVTIVRQPVKAASSNGQVLVEIHGDGKVDLEKEAVKLLERKGLLSRVDRGQLKAAIGARSGMPTDITERE